MRSPRLAGAIEGLLRWILPRYVIATAFRRHLEWLPSIDGALSRTERQALSILPEQGSLAGGRVFPEGQRLEEQIFIGDGCFYRIIANLSSDRHPLLVSNTPQAGLGTVTITEAGTDVIEGAGGPHRAKRHRSMAWRWSPER